MPNMCCVTGCYTNFNESPKKTVFKFPGDPALSKTYLIFDTVHVMKNIRNNLLAKKFFQVPPLDVTVMDGVINIPPGTIRWSTFHRVHENDLAIECHV